MSGFDHYKDKQSVLDRHEKEHDPRVALSFFLVSVDDHVADNRAGDEL